MMRNSFVRMTVRITALMVAGLAAGCYESQFPPDPVSEWAGACWVP